MSLFRNAVENVSYQTKEDWTKSSPECCSISVFKNRLQNSKENTRADNKLNKDDQSYSPFIVCKYSKFTWIIFLRKNGNAPIKKIYGAVAATFPISVKI